MFKIATYWFITTLVALLAWFVYFPKSLLSHMVLFIWVISGIVVLYRARKVERSRMPDFQRIFFLIIGTLIIILSFINQIFNFINIQFIFWNPPYSIGEFAVLVSGLTIIFFTILGYRPLMLPASFPLITLFVYQVFDLFQENIEWIASPLLGPTTWLSVKVLNLLGINASISSDYVINFLTREGQMMNIPIVIDCTGIWSLGAFTASVLLVAMVFPRIFSRKGPLFIAIGYIGTYAANIIRVTIICFSAYLYGYSGATIMTHIHAGWIAFSIWMFIFWYFFFSRYLLKKEGKK